MFVDRAEPRTAETIRTALERIVNPNPEFEGDTPQLFLDLAEIYEVTASEETNGVVENFYDIGRRYKLI